MPGVETGRRRGRPLLRVRRKAWELSYRLVCELDVLCFALDGSFQRAIEGGFGLLVFLLRDLALLVLDFELEEFFLQRLEQHGRASGSVRGRRWRTVVGSSRRSIAWGSRGTRGLLHGSRWSRHAAGGHGLGNVHVLA